MIKLGPAYAQAAALKLLAAAMEAIHGYENPQGWLDVELPAGQSLIPALLHLLNSDSEAILRPLLTVLSCSTTTVKRSRGSGTMRVQASCRHNVFCKAAVDQGLVRHLASYMALHPQCTSLHWEHLVRLLWALRHNGSAAVVSELVQPLVQQLGSAAACDRLLAAKAVPVLCQSSLALLLQEGACTALLQQLQAGGSREEQHAVLQALQSMIHCSNEVHRKQLVAAGPVAACQPLAYPGWHIDLLRSQQEVVDLLGEQAAAHGPVHARVLYLRMFGMYLTSEARRVAGAVKGLYCRCEAAAAESMSMGVLVALLCSSVAILVWLMGVV